MSTADAPGSDLDLPRSDWLLGVPLRAFLRPRALQGVVLVAVAVALVVWPHRTDRALGLVVGLGCLAYAGFSLIDLGRFGDAEAASYEWRDASEDNLAAYLGSPICSEELEIEDAELAASQFLGLIKGVEHSGVLLGIADAETELQRRKRIDTSVDAFMKLYGRN